MCHALRKIPEGGLQWKLVDRVRSQIAGMLLQSELRRVYSWDLQQSDGNFRGTCWDILFQQPGNGVICSTWILPVVLRARLATTPQPLAKHLPLQSCSLATPRWSHITKVLLAKRKMKAYACHLHSTTLAPHTLTACSLLIKCAGPCCNKGGQWGLWP